MKAIYFWHEYLDDFHYCKDVLARIDDIKKEVIALVTDRDNLVDYPKYKVLDEWMYDFGWRAAPFSRYEGEFLSSEDGSDQAKRLNEIINRTKSGCPTLSEIVSPLERIYEGFTGA